MPRVVNERMDVLPALGELFREYGYDGASLALIGEKTGLGKGSLYHFFPDGKEEMAAAVLADIDRWFAEHLLKPLREGADARAAIRTMFRTVDGYFCSGRRICLVGAFALCHVRDRHARRINDYFATWVDELAAALRRAGKKPRVARELAEDVVASIQGALVLGRAIDDGAVFTRMLKRLQARLDLSASPD